MLAQQTNVDVIANNLANMNTTAYTNRRAQFTDLVYQNVIRPGSASTASQTIVPSGIQLGLGVRTAAVYRITDGDGKCIDSCPTCIFSRSVRIGKVGFGII